MPNTPRSRGWRGNSFRESFSQGEARLRGGAGLLLLEDGLAAAIVGVDRVLGREAALEDRLGEGVLELRLDGALERPRAVDRIEAGFRQLGDRRVRDLEAEVHLRQARLERAEL